MDQGGNATTKPNNPSLMDNDAHRWRNDTEDMNRPSCRKIGVTTVGWVMNLLLWINLSAAAPSSALTKPSPTATPDLVSFPLPALLLCVGEDGLVRLSLKGDKAVTLFSGGDIHDVQPQRDGSYLVIGGTNGVTSLKRDPSTQEMSIVWSWEEMNLPCLTNAVAADWEWNGRPSLILATDCTLNRLVLAEARTREPKIRWEFKLPAPPRRAILCADTGNFLVTLDSRLTGLGEPPQVAEVHYKENRVGWSLDSRDGIVLAQDAVREKNGHTLVVAGKRAELYCFSMDKILIWKKPLGLTQDASHTLSLVKSGGRTLLLAWARPKGLAHSTQTKPSRPQRPSGLYLVDPENGKVLAFRKIIQEGPAPVQVVPDDASAVQRIP